MGCAPLGGRGPGGADHGEEVEPCLHHLNPRSDKLAQDAPNPVDQRPLGVEPCLRALARERTSAQTAAKQASRKPKRMWIAAPAIGVGLPAVRPRLILSSPPDEIRVRRQDLTVQSRDQP
jgi:hypothetical protein